MRICIIVLDSVGIGAMPDAAEYGDVGAHTLGNIYAQRGKLDLPNLYSLGLAHIKDARLPKTGKPVASFGRLAAKTRAKDTTSGHWELAGLIMEPPFVTVTEFPEKLIMEWLEKAANEGLWQFGTDGKMVWNDVASNLHAVGAGSSRPSSPKEQDFGHICQLSTSDISSGREDPAPTMYKADLLGQGPNPTFLANRPASGTQIIDELGEAHIKTGAPIVYTSADSVFQVAAHEGIIPIQTQYRLCQIAREMLTGDYTIGRVIARPFVGTPGDFSRTKNRRDYAVPPVGETILERLDKKGQTTFGIGKIDDIFCNVGVAHSNHTTNNADGVAATIDALKNNNRDTIIFTNLVDFDMRYGHRNDVDGYGAALEVFDTQLPQILEALRPDDLLIITADHGCDPTMPSTDHSREYVPVLVYGGKAVDLGTRDTFADVGATIYEALGHGKWPVGESFLGEI